MPLKWYSGFNASTDEVYWGTNPASLAKVGATVTAARGQHTSTANVTVTPGKTYYFKVITDGSISSDLWSYQVVNWQCPLDAIDSYHISGPEWDTNGDCVVNDEDFWYFAKDWRIPRVAGDDYTLQPGDDLWRYINEWLLCDNRTNGGCAGW
ncbi:MAG: hypothetical protein BWY69_00122 [Planctomycetes bacterium ADurb.Bin401]|nr:MAG: hypothetical protein BWY69_00122 [Planctomycetes bacterium ADurb.Bin401]